MGIFGRRDELFEIMSKSPREGEGSSGSPNMRFAPRPRLKSTMVIEEDPAGPRSTTTKDTPRPGVKLGATTRKESRIISGPSSALNSSASGSHSASRSKSSSFHKAGRGEFEESGAQDRAPVPAFGLGLPKGITETGLWDRLVGRANTGDDLFDIDGDALVIVDEDEDWADAPEEDPDGMRTFRLRGDTAIVGAILVAGLLLTAFLMGRTSDAPAASDDGTVAAASAVEGAGTLIDASAVEEEAAVEVAQAPATPDNPRLPTREEVLADIPTYAGGTQGTTLAASAPRTVSEGTKRLLVVTTTEEKAVQVAQWLNENSLSPIFGRRDVQAQTSGGSVRIVGFQREENDVLARVRSTVDPTNGRGTFRDAYFVTVR
jgi:hypothetical protein